jgi:hypothetical protein
MVPQSLCLDWFALVFMDLICWQVFFFFKHFHVIFYPGFRSERALVQFLVRIFLLSPSVKAWFQVFI